MNDPRTTPADLAVDARGAHLQVQVEQVNVALQQLRQTQGSLQEMQARLADMTRDCASVLDRWNSTDEKHAAAVVELHSRLSEWSDIERRLLNESSTRIHQFERDVHQEWAALKQKHEEPLQQLEAQAARIADTCLTAVDHALRGFDRAEARLAALEQELYREMGTLSREVREAVAELRHTQQLGPRQPWSLDNVVRLHQELRAEADDRPDPLALPAVAGAAALDVDVVPLGPVRLEDRQPTPPREAAVAVVEGPPVATTDTPPAAGVPASAAEPPAATSAWRAPRLAIGVLLAVIALYGAYLQWQVRTAMRDAAARADAAERGASATRAETQREIAAVQQAADARLASVQQAASSAQRVAIVTTAPDLVRFALVSRLRGEASAQVLFSRSQGVAITGARLAIVPQGRTYQLWLIGGTGPVSAGTFVPAEDGRLAAAFDTPASLPRPVVGALITQEPAGGSPRPTSPAYLSVAAPPAAPAP